ncbi:MAG: hypothetical protein V3W04_07550 [Gammaproteobacteria bacterium]
MTTDKQQNWDNATWEGSRKMQLQRSLKLSPEERFNALETLAKTSDWLFNASRKDNEEVLSVKESRTKYTKR